MMSRSKEKRSKEYQVPYYYNTNGSNTKKDFLALLKKDDPNIIINVTDLKCIVTVNSEIYSQEDAEKLEKIVNGLSKSIWIDRTYVSYRGNRFKDAFIREDGWHSMVKLLIEDCFKRTNREKSTTAMASLMTISQIYLYTMVEKYGYESEYVSIEFDDNVNFGTSYYIDERSSWNY